MTRPTTGSYVATVLGFLFGSGVGGVLGLLVGSRFQSPGTIAGIISTLLLDAFVGAAIGANLGCWGLLRVCAYPAASRTVRNLIVGWILIGALLVSTDFTNTFGPSTLWIGLVMIVGVCICARWVALEHPKP